MPDPLKSEDIAAYLEQSRGLERDHLGELVRSRKRAWQVNVCKATLFLLKRQH